MKKQVTKKQTGNGIWVSVASLIMAIASLVIYNISVASAKGYFSDNYDQMISTLSILSIAFIALSCLISLPKAKGTTAKVMNTVKTILTVATCLCLGYVVGCIVGAIANEFAFTYFSDFNIGTVKENFIPGALTQAMIAIVLAILAIIVNEASNLFKKNN